MKKPLLLLFFLLLSVFSNAQIWQFQKTYGAGNRYLITDVDVISNGSYIATADMHDTLTGTDEALVLKLDAAGALQWKKIYPTGSVDVFYSVDCTTDGGFIFAGYTNVTGVQAIYLVKTDSNGTTQWSRIFSDSTTAFAACVRQTSDGNYILAGGASSASNNSKVMLARVSSTGSLLWANKYGAPGVSKESGFDVVETNDGGFATVGYTGSYGSGGDDLYVVKTDGAGNLLWANAYGETFGELGAAISRVNHENGFYVFGSSASFNANHYDEAYLLKIDSAGNLNWSRTYAGPGTVILDGNSFVQSADNNLTLFCSSIDASNGNSNFYLLHTDANGNLDWSKKYFHTQLCTAEKMRETFYHGYILSGADGGSYYGSLYLVKTDSLGNSGCGEGNGGVTMNVPLTLRYTGGMQFPFGTTSYPSIDPQNATVAENTLCVLAGENESVAEPFSLSVFPNPANGKITIEAAQSLQQVVVEDLMGQYIFHSETNSNSLMIDLSSQPAGIYLVRVKTEKGWTTRKLVMQ